MLVWYAVQSTPGGEAKALKGLLEQGFATYLPEEVRWGRAKAGKRERKAKPLFTGYLFAGLCPGQSLYQVRLVDGVRGVVTTGQGVPAELNARFVYDLQARQKAGEFDHTPAKRSEYAKGDDAKILKGPFQGYIGEVLAADDDGRVKLLLSGVFIKGEHSFDDDQLEPVKKAA